MNRGATRFFGRGRGGDRRSAPHRPLGPPDHVVEVGSFIHAVEDEMFCSSLLSDKVPHFNAPVYLQNKSMIGKVDEILGPINEVYFSVKMGDGMVASSFKRGDKVYIGGDKLLPIERFLPKQKVSAGVTKRGRGRQNTLNRGGRGQVWGNFQRRNGRGLSRGFSGDRGRAGMRGRGGSRGRGSFRG